MKAMLMALVITAFAYSSAEAQNRYTIVEKETCRPSANKESLTCYKNVSYYNNDVYQGELPTQVLIKNNKSSDDDNLQYCERSPKSNVIVCYNTKPETRTYYKVCHDDGGYNSYCTPYIPTNTTFPFSDL